MNLSKLSKSEINALLIHYDSELKRLQFQQQSIAEIIHQLHLKLLDELSGHSIQQEFIHQLDIDLAGLTQNNLYKTISSNGVEGKSHQSRQSKSKKRRYLKNSPWPDFILTLLNQHQEGLSSTQIYKHGIKEAAINFPELEDDQIRIYISRALHKLSNEQEELLKLPNPNGKGYVYVLKDQLKH